MGCRPELGRGPRALPNVARAYQECHSTIAKRFRWMHSVLFGRPAGPGQLITITGVLSVLMIARSNLRMYRERARWRSGNRAARPVAVPTLTGDAVSN